MGYRFGDFEHDFDPEENYKDDEEDELSFMHALCSADAGNDEYTYEGEQEVRRGLLQICGGTRQQAGKRGVKEIFRH